MIKALRIYFWIYLIFVLLAIISSGTILTLDLSLLPSLVWFLSGYLLLFPVHALLYFYRLSMELFWKILIPASILITLLTLFGVVSISGPINFTNTIQFPPLVPALIELPILILATLYWLEFKFYKDQLKTEANDN